MFRLLLTEIWPALFAHRLRTFLTTLGMVIGVSAVVLMLAIGDGVRDSVNRMISSIGSNLLIILSGSATNQGGIRMGMSALPTLTQSDAEAVAELPHVLATAPIVFGTIQAVCGANNWSTMIAGVTPSYFAIRDWATESGGIFDEVDVRSAARVAVIGKTAAKHLCDDENIVGKIIRIKNTPYLIVGLLSAKGQALDGRDNDDVIFVPLTTAQKKLLGSKFAGSVRFIVVQADSEAAVTELIKPVTELLRSRHRIMNGEENDFNVQSLTSITEIAERTARLLSLMLGIIASISLVVGGIGIMNIMLVSVMERTREIGIRASLGATRRDILWQFLLEAILVSLSGCIIGVMVGVGGAFVVHGIWGINIIISLHSIILAFMVSGGVGVFFGYYPAYKAANLKPIEALRYQ